MMRHESMLVYDVGMHNGDDAAYALHRGHRVVAVEANPAMVEHGRKRFADAIREGRLTIVPAAVAERDGPVTLHISKAHSDWTSLDPSIAGRDDGEVEETTVEGRRFESIVEEHGLPDVLKVDIEGADGLCFDGFRADWKPRWASVELARTRMAGLATAQRLYELGYRKFRCVDQVSFRPLDPPSKELAREAWRPAPLRSPGGWMHWLKERLAEGPRNARTPATHRAGLKARLGWEFPAGSSGPLPYEHLGEWLTLQEALGAWLLDELGLSRRGGGRRWCDLCCEANG